MKLAIVDDNPEELQKLYRTIMDYSCTHDVAIACDRFATSAAFLSACAQISYSFVIFDIYLQDTTGIDLAAEFRRIAPRTPIVFLTSSPEHRADAFRVHAFDYLEKPVTGEMIARLFDELAITQEEETDTQAFSISIDRKQIPVLYSDIRYITSDSNYLQIQGARCVPLPHAISRSRIHPHTGRTVSDHQPGDTHQPGLCAAYGERFLHHVRLHNIFDS